MVYAFPEASTIWDAGGLSVQFVDGGRPPLVPDELAELLVPWPPLLELDEAFDPLEPLLPVELTLPLLLPLLLMLPLPLLLEDPLLEEELSLEPLLVPAPVEELPPVVSVTVPFEQLASASNAAAM
jgi:hypothetical protein